MKIDIADAVRNEGEVYTKVYDGELENIDFMGETFGFPKVHVDAEYRYDGEGLTVEGDFKAKTEVTCSRCLKPFMYPVEFEFMEYYAKDPQQDEGVYEYTGDIITLDTMLQDNVIMNLPMRFLCKESCKGLCTVCGKNLNEGKCGCETKETDSRLQGLAGFNTGVPKKP